MTWGAVGGAAVSVVGSMIGGSKAKKAAAKQQEAAEEAQRKAAIQQQIMQRENQEWTNTKNIANTQQEQAMNRENYGWSNDLNRSNQSWAQGLNQEALDRQADTNRLSGTNAMGTSMGYDENGNYKQTLGGADQSNLDALRGKTGDIIGGMGQQFGVNNDVMNAYRGVNQPLVDQQRNKENARLAAMGLGTGSGSAWGQAQDALNRNQVNSDQNAILQGNNAWLQGQNLLNNQLGAMNQTRSGIQSGTAAPDYWKQGAYAGVTSPNVGSWNSNIADISTAGAQGMDPNAAMQAGQVAGAGVQQGWNQMGQQLGGLATQGINSWNTAGAQPGIDPNNISNVPTQAWLNQQGGTS